MTDGKKTGRSTTGEAGKSDNLEDMEMEEEKRHLINREIDKFRDTYKVRKRDAVVAMNDCPMPGMRCKRSEDRSVSLWTCTDSSPVSFHT